MSELTGSVVRSFVERINAHDPEGLAGLLSPGHRLTDSLGAVVAGRAAVVKAWRGYFALFPDYRIEITTLLSGDELVLLTGWAAASVRGQGPGWRLPAAWRALVRDGLVAEWQVYADNTPVHELLRAAGAPPAQP